MCQGGIFTGSTLWLDIFEEVNYYINTSPGINLVLYSRECMNFGHFWSLALVSIYLWSGVALYLAGDSWISLFMYHPIILELNMIYWTCVIIWVLSQLCKLSDICCLFGPTMTYFFFSLFCLQSFMCPSGIDDFPMTTIDHIKVHWCEVIAGIFFNQFNEILYISLHTHSLLLSY